MSLVGGLGAIGGGFMQGMDQAHSLRLKAAQLQEYQMKLDAAKRDLAAQGSIFANMGQMNGGGGQGQSQMGQSTGQPPAMTGTPPGPQQAPPMGQPPMGARPPVAPAAAGPGPQQSGPGGPQQQGGPPSPYQTLLGIARSIKQRNPNIDPATLADAVGQTVEMMKGLAPDYRAEMQMVLQQMKDVAAGQRQDKADATKITVVGEQQAGADRRQGMRDATQMDAIAARGDQQRQNIGLTQKFINDRAKSGQLSKAKADAQKNRERQLSDRLKATTQVLNTLRNSGSTDQDQIDKAISDYNDAEKDYEVFQARIGYDDGSSGGGQGNAGAASKTMDQLPAVGSSAKGHADGTKLKDEKGNVVLEVKDGKWVKPSNATVHARAA